MRARAAASRATKLLESVVLTTYSNIDETHDLLRHPAPPFPPPPLTPSPPTAPHRASPPPAPSMPAIPPCL